MSIHDFGSTVEEVQQKLSEILPLVDSGENQAEQTVAAIQESGPTWSASLDEVASNCRQDVVLMAGSQDSLNELQEGVTQTLGDQASLMTELAAKATEAFEAANAGYDTARQQLDSGREQLATVVVEMEDQFNQSKQMARSLLDELGSAKESLHNVEDAFNVEENEAVDGVNESSAQSARAIAAFQEELGGTHTTAMDQSFQKLESMRQGFLSAVELQMNEGQEELTECFETLQGDVEIVAQAHIDRLGSIAGDVADDLEQDGEIELELRQASDGLLEYGLETVSSEAVETVIVCGVMLNALALLPPLVSGIGGVRALARRINDAL